MKKYTVSIYPMPKVYEDIEAEDEQQAELFAMESYNGNNEQDIYKITIK